MIFLQIFFLRLKIGNTVNNQLGELFPPEKYPEVEVIAEPGRYFATSAYTLYTKVIGKKTKRSTSGIYKMF